MNNKNTFSVNASKVIDARSEVLYDLLTDYQVAHQAILPKPYFRDVQIEKGGKGAGTQLWVHLTMFGQKYTYHQLVSEPEPGRVLQETDLQTGQYTQFLFEPLNGGMQTRLTIRSVFPAKGGIAGLMERLMQPPVVRRLYMQELDNIAAYVRKGTGKAG